MRSLFAALLAIGVHCSLSASVYLLNDSPFPLKAVVIAANGTNVGEQEVQPGVTTYMEDELGGSNPTNREMESFENYSSSMTPYTVFWYCKDGTLYSSCQDVSAGATVTANSCNGSKYCKPPKPPEQGNEGDSNSQD